MDPLFGWQKMGQIISPDIVNDSTADIQHAAMTFTQEYRLHLP